MSRPDTSPWISGLLAPKPVITPIRLIDGSSAGLKKDLSDSICLEATYVMDSNLNSTDAHRSAGARVMIELAGMPRSGKDTVIGLLSSRLRNAGYRMEVVEESARLCPFDKHDHFAFTRWGLHRIMNRILEWQHAPRPVETHIALLNRGLFDASAFFELLAYQGAMPKRDLQIISDYIRAGSVAQSIGRIFLLMIPPELAMFRDKKAGRVRVTGRVMNRKTLSELRRCYYNLALDPYWAQRLTIIEAETLTPFDVADSIWSSVVEVGERAHLR
jgi:thymidylate kinase